MTHVKICGFQTAEPAIAAVEAGADAIGLVFVPSARRCLSLADAKPLLAEVRSHFTLQRSPKVIGLFANQPAEEINAHVALLELDAVQLCGREGMAECAAVNAPVHKVIAIDPQVPVSAQLPRIMVLQQRHRLAGHHVVLDTKVAGEYGGTGQTFDWELAADLAQAFEMSLAGGLTPDNVGQAVTGVRPWGVDTSSGVESDGEKDPQKVRDFVAAVRAADAAPRPGILSRLLGKA